MRPSHEGMVGLGSSFPPRGVSPNAHRLWRLRVAPTAGPRARDHGLHPGCTTHRWGARLPRVRRVLPVLATGLLGLGAAAGAIAGSPGACQAHRRAPG